MDYLNTIKNKIHQSPAEIATDLARWKFEGKRIVFTNGCFDIIHKGHIHYLAQAASLGDIFIVGLNSDDSVSRLKGPTRPIVPQDGRAIAMASLLFVDKVVIFDEDTPADLITAIKPFYLVKGGDYTKETIVGAELVESIGGQVHVIPFVDGFSTTNIINKIKQEC
jgi:rfaE bifunctional protein nucleotidyltransferase chain/domain